MNGAPSLPVLLVEDDPDLAANLQDYLEAQGWKVDYAPDGAMALHKLIDGRFAAGVFDLNLPGLGAWNFAPGSVPTSPPPFPS